MEKKSSYWRIYKAVKRIPKGKVATYGQIANLADLPGGARQVGYALHCLPDGTETPWHRVINSKGRISLQPDGLPGNLQRALLRSEGIAFNPDGAVPLEKYQWQARGKIGISRSPTVFRKTPTRTARS